MSEVRIDWTRAEIAALFDLPFDELMWRAQGVHREHHAAGEVQLCTLLSIKTGGCPEDCGYCSQSTFADSGLKASKIMEVEAVLAAAAEAKAAGSQRFCMGAAWREPKDRDMDAVVAMVEGVRALGLETCMTLGMLEPHQAERLAAAGLDYYNHNIDTSPEYYFSIISTRTFANRLETLENVRAAGINVCCGGIVGMGEDREDRVGFVHALATLPRHPESVPVNALVPVRGTVLGDMLADTPMAKIDDIEFVRTVAVARIAMPLSMVRLSAGRESMSEATQALCFMAGANSIFTGDKLLTTGNRGDSADAALFAKLGLVPMEAQEPMRNHEQRADPSLVEGDYVRIRSGSAHRSYSGAIGQVARKTFQQTKYGWVGVEIGGITLDYAPDEIERTCFWAYSTNARESWSGPFSSWSDASEAIVDLIDEVVQFPADHPVGHKANQLKTAFRTSQASVTGYVGALDRGGLFYIVPHGAERPLHPPR